MRDFNDILYFPFAKSELISIYVLKCQVVKAFIVLTNEASSSTQTEDESNKLVKELQDHVKRITAPYKYPRKVSQLSRSINMKLFIYFLQYNIF